MICYRWKHIPSGMYWRPSREVLVTFKDKDDPKRTHRIWVKSNLSKKGKIYPMKPSEAWRGSCFYNHLAAKAAMVQIGKCPYKHSYELCRTVYPVIENEWVLEEI